MARLIKKGLANSSVTCMLVAPVQVGMKKDADGSTDIDWCRAKTLTSWDDLRKTFQKVSPILLSVLRRDHLRPKPSIHYPTPAPSLSYLSTHTLSGQC